MTLFLFFADDWGRHPSSSQYLAKELAKKHSVLWTNTIGTRPLRLDTYTLRRGIEKIRQWIKGSSGQSLNTYLHVINPIQWPSWRTRIGRTLSGKFILQSMIPFLRDRCECIIGITALPLPPEWLDLIPSDYWVYYCVDDFSDWPGLEGNLLRQFEHDIIHRARLIVAVSDVLRQYISSFGRVSYVLPHGIDLELWQKKDSKSTSSIPSIPKPAAVWWGLVDERLDWNWLAYAANELNNLHFVLVGRIHARPSSILKYKNIHFVDSVNVSQLPLLAERADVLMMPYVNNAATRAMQPLKLLEYLASNRPIVARRLPALEKWSDSFLLVEDKYEFTEALRNGLSQEIRPEEKERRWACLQAHSWAAKAQQFLRWLRNAHLLA